MPKVTIFLKEVPGIVPKCSICGICESSRALHSIEPLVNASQLFISLAGSVRMQEGVIGQQGYGGRGISDTIIIDSFRSVNHTNPGKKLLVEVGSKNA